MLKNIRIVALASFIEGLITLIWLAVIPASGGIFSPIRLLSLSGILLISLGGLAVFIYARSENRFTKKIGLIENSGAGLPVSFLLLAVSLAVWVSVLYKDQLLLLIDEAVYTRLLPIVLFGILLCLQWGMLFLIPNIDKDRGSNIFGPVWKPALILLGSFLAIWGVIAGTHIGFFHDNVGLSWGPPGVPISFPQVNFIFGISILLTFAYSILRSKTSITIPFRDILIFTGLWALAVILWSNTPVSATHFNPPPMSPNYQTYPNSDALIFDKSAYHLLYGTGFSNQLARRPLYVGMLALFHKIAGAGYEGTIFLQILVLALIPSLIYLLTSKLSNRLAGLIAGGLILLREKNAIEMSGKIVTSNAKLMMSDMIAMLGVIAFVYVTIQMFSKKERSIWSLGIIGACLGLTALVRAQVLILIPVVFLFIFMENKSFKLKFKDSVFIMLGIVLALLPWAWRNWNLTGTFVLDDRGEERLLARDYSSNPTALPLPLPSETDVEFSARLKQEIFTFMLEHPSDVMFFVSNHFFRNLATSAVYLAPTYSNTSPQRLVDETSFWEDWNGKLTENSTGALFVNLVIMALGISIVQRTNKFTGWFPLVVFLFYSGGNALVRSSGWRFSLPADWVVLVYYSVALAYIPSKIKFVVTEINKVHSGNETFPIQRTRAELIIFCGLLLMGASVPMAERVIPLREFSNLTQKAKEDLSHGNVISSSSMETFLEQKNAVLLSGIALYPRYITLNSRVHLADTPSRDFKYLHFWLINDGDNQVIFPVQTPPDAFPHTATVSVLGCKEEGYILAQVILMQSPSTQTLIKDNPDELNCP